MIWIGCKFSWRYPSQWPRNCPKLTLTPRANLPGRARPGIFRIHFGNAHPHARGGLRSRLSHTLLPHPQHAQRILDFASRDGLWYSVQCPRRFRCFYAILTASHVGKVRLQNNASCCGSGSHYTHGTSDPLPQRAFAAFRARKNFQDELDLFQEPSILDLLDFELITGTWMFLPGFISTLLRIDSQPQQQDGRTRLGTDEYLSGLWAVCDWVSIRPQSFTRRSGLSVNHGRSICLPLPMETSHVAPAVGPLCHCVWIRRDRTYGHLGEVVHDHHR